MFDNGEGRKETYIFPGWCLVRAEMFQTRRHGDLKMTIGIPYMRQSVPCPFDKGQIFLGQIREHYNDILMRTRDTGHRTRFMHPCVGSRGDLRYEIDVFYKRKFNDKAYLQHE